MLETKNSIIGIIGVILVWLVVFGVIIIFFGPVVGYLSESILVIIVRPAVNMAPLISFVGTILLFLYPNKKGIFRASKIVGIIVTIMTLFLYFLMNVCKHGC